MKGNIFTTKIYDVIAPEIDISKVLIKKKTTHMLAPLHSYERYNSPFKLSSPLSPMSPLSSRKSLPKAISVCRRSRNSFKSAQVSPVASGMFNTKKE